MITLLPKDTPALSLRTSLSYGNLVFRFEHDQTIYLECTFLFDAQIKKVVGRYFQYPEIEKTVDQFIGAMISQADEHIIWPSGFVPLSESVLNYISIAESIATQAYQSSSGDDYRPSCFSKIMITDEGIMLEQNNHMNSKSLAHKQDYSLRDLEFYISYSTQKPEKRHFEEEYIGEMRIRFSDRSSANNRHGGDKIRQQIELERQKFNV